MGRNLEFEVKPYPFKHKFSQEPQLQFKELVIFLGSLELKVKLCPDSCTIILLHQRTGLPLGLALGIVSDHPPQALGLSAGVLAVQKGSNGTTGVNGQAVLTHQSLLWRSHLFCSQRGSSGYHWASRTVKPSFSISVLKATTHPAQLTSNLLRSLV